jgi:tetratricopeptide (TPR) repeat protein
MRIYRTALLAASFALATILASGQTTGTTVRKHRVAEQSPVDAAIANAETAIDKKDYTTAEKSLRDAIAQDANNYRAWFDLAFVFNANGQSAQSIEAYRKSIAANPFLFESNLNLGLMLARNGDPEAEKYLRAATQLKPSSHPQDELTRAWLALGHFLEKSSPARAVEAYKAAAILQPKNAAPHLAAAAALEGLKQYTAAETEYKRAAELDPKSPEALAGLVNIYQNNGRLPEAELALRKYIALDPQNATAYTQLGRVLAALGKNEEAIATLQTSLKLSPDNPTTVRQLVELFSDSKKYAEAEALLAPMLKQSPNDAALHYEMGRLLMREHNFPAAQQELITALKIKGDMAEAYGDLAVVANDNSNYELALRALDARSKFLEETPGTYFLRATAYDHLKATKQAIDNYHLFLQVSEGKFPDQEWKARHRLIALEPKR